MTAELRRRLCDLLEREGALHSPAIREAFLHVPRELFVPHVPVEQVYEDRPFYTKLLNGQPISSSSQPAIMAAMLEQLGLAAGQHVLEIGAGTGYNAALMGHMVGPSGRVVTVDIDEDIVDAARDHLNAAGAGNVIAACADGAEGFPAMAPYDRIILTVGAWDIAPAWLEQLRPDGRLLLPLSFRRVQKSVALEWRDGYLESTSVESCGFMRMRGSLVGTERVIRLGSPDGPYLTIDSPRPIDADRIAAALNESPRTQAAGVEICTREGTGSLSLWLALHDADSCSLAVFGPPSLVGASPVPLLLEYQSGERLERSTYALVGDAGLVCLSRPRNARLGEEHWPLSIVNFSAEPELVDRLRHHLEDWNRAGQPPADRLRIRAYPGSPHLDVSAGAHVIPKRFTTLVVSQD